MVGEDAAYEVTSNKDNKKMQMEMAITGKEEVEGKTAERGGSEIITVPAGTYTCEHWRAKDGSGDYWISDNVCPMGLVKMTGKDSSMVLQRQITGATTKLPPPYKKFDMQEMMRQGQAQHP